MDSFMSCFVLTWRRSTILARLARTHCCKYQWGDVLTVSFRPIASNVTLSKYQIPRSRFKVDRRHKTTKEGYFNKSQRQSGESTTFQKTSAYPRLITKVSTISAGWTLRGFLWNASRGLMEYIYLVLVWYVLFFCSYLFTWSFPLPQDDSSGVSAPTAKWECTTVLHCRPTT